MSETARPESQRTFSATPSDCLAATSPEEHENAIRFDYPMFSEVMTADAFASELHGAAAGSS